MARPKETALFLLKLILLSCLLAFVGCASSGKAIFDYTSNMKSEKPPIKAELFLTANVSQMPLTVRLARQGGEAFSGLEQAIRNDLGTNLFNFVEDEYPDIKVRINLKHIKDKTALDYVYMYFGYGYFYAWPLGLPRTRVTGNAKVEMVIEDRMGREIASYVSQEKLSKFIGLYYGRDANVGKKKWPPRVVLRSVMDNLKGQVVADYDKIAAAIEKSGAPAVALAPTKPPATRIESIVETDTTSPFASEPTGESVEESSLPNRTAVETPPAAAPAPVKRVKYSEPAGGRTTAAVFDLKATGVPEATAQILTLWLQDELFRTKRYILVNRGDVKSVLAEQAFTMTGVAESAVEAGKILAVRKIVVGTVGKLGKNYIITVSLTDVETSKIEKNASVQKKVKEEQLLTLVQDVVAQMIAQ